MADVLKMYGKAGNKLDSWTSGATVKLAMCQNTYTPNQDTDEYFNVITAVETTVAISPGYTLGGHTITGCSTAYTATSNETAFKAAATVWTGSLTAKYLVGYVVGTSTDTSALLFYITLTGDITSEAGTFTCNWDAEGAFKTTVAS